MTTGGALLSCSPVKLVKIIFKKQSSEDSGNSPKCKQKINKHQFNKIYENSVRKARVWYLNQDSFLLSLLSAQQGRDSTPDCCSQEHGAPTLPRPQAPGRGLSSQKKQNFSVSPPTSSSLLLRFTARWVSSSEKWGLLFCPNPTHGMRICIRHGTLKIVLLQ